MLFILIVAALLLHQGKSDCISRDRTPREQEPKSEISKRLPIRYYTTWHRRRDEAEPVTIQDAKEGRPKTQEPTLYLSQSPSIDKLKDLLQDIPRSKKEPASKDDRKRNGIYHIDRPPIFNSYLTEHENEEERKYKDFQNYLQYLLEKMQLL